MRFDRTPPPARRATDRYMAVGLFGVAGLGWAAVIRYAIAGEWIIVVVYSAWTLLITYGAVGMAAAVVRYARARRRAERMNRPRPPV